jgi:hypothetical protein
MVTELSDKVLPSVAPIKTMALPPLNPAPSVNPVNSILEENHTPYLG